MGPLADLIGESPAIAAVRAQVGRLLQHRHASRRLPSVLILGETGTGKGLVAKLMHGVGPRSNRPFVAVNCAAIPDTLLEAELFGFERGAFTDARQGKAGLFQSAHGGTLFLDEIGALPFSLQAKLLTALEERMIRPLGSIRTEPADAWIMAATSEDLPTAIRERRFREDLYHRVSGMTIALPSLRERGPDILVLAEHFLGRVCADYALAPKRLAPDARSALLTYSWPGNVRELANLMERVAVLVEGASISAQDLDLRSFPPVADPPPAVEAEQSLRSSMGDFERTQLLAALESAGGNLSRAAALLGVPRNSLRYRLEKHGLNLEGPPLAEIKSRRITARREASPAASIQGPRRKAEPIDTRQPVTFLWAELCSLQEPLPPAQTGQALGVVLEKIRAFGGVPAEIGATNVVAIFPPEPAEGASRAVHAVLAIQRAARLPGATGDSCLSTKSAIHVAECRIQGETAAEPLDPADWAAVLVALRHLAKDIAADTMLISQEAVPFVARRFGLHHVAADPERRPPAASGVVLHTPAIAYKPSIAVLPFRNLSGDAEQEYFGDGITEDIIGALSRLRWLFVIARSSTLAFKSNDADTRRIAADLGVRYLLTGTVRKVNAQLRVTAELTDAEAQSAIWIERYDGTLTDIFDFQDRIAGRIVGTLDAKVRGAEIERAMQKRPERLDAYDCVLRALSLAHRFSSPDFFRADELLERAIALDPDFASSYAWRAWWYLFKIGEGVSSNVEADTQEASRFAEAALERDPDDPMALAVSGYVSARLYRDYDRALRRFERALALNPNSAFAWGLSGAAFCYAGEPAVARDRALYAMRLSPFDLFTFFFASIAGLGEMLAGRYEEAVVWAMKSRSEKPKYSANLRKLAACLAHLGRLEEAREVAREFHALQSSFTLSEFRRRYPLRDQVALEQYVTGLRIAGLPE